MRASRPIGPAAVWLACALASAAACGDGGGGPTDEPDDVIGPAGGAVVSSGLRLDIPAGALTEDVRISVEPVTLSASAVPAGYEVIAGTAFRLGPAGQSFQAPFQVAISYAASNLPAGVAETSLGVLHLNGGATMLQSVVDAGADVVRASADHFSVFAVGASTGPYETVPCPALSVAASAGVPLDEVAIGRVPASFAPPLAARVDAGVAAEPTYTFVELDESGDARLSVPLHPSGSVGGGAVRLTVTDGTSACAPFDFTIQPLPAAPGELHAIADALQDIVRAQAAVLGTTPEELNSTPAADIPTDMLPIALVQSLIEHPQNEGSLRAIVNGTAPASAGARMDLLEPLLARAGLRPALEASASAALASAREWSARAANLARDLAGADAAAGVERVESRSAIVVGLCSPESVGSDAGLLDHCMGLAADAVFDLESMSTQVMKDAAKAFGKLASLPAGVAGAGEAAGIGGFVSWLTVNEDTRNAAMLPSVLTSMTIDPSPAEFLEDDESSGSWTPAYVTAANGGWDMGKEALEALLQTSGVAGTFDKYHVSDVEVPGIVGNYLTGPVADRLLSGGTPAEFQLQPQVYGPVNVSEDRWSEARIAAGDAVEVTTHGDYEPRRAGTAVLSVRTEDGAFGGQQVATQADIRVKELQITITPDEVRLKPNEPQTFTVKVVDSKHPEMVDADLSRVLQGSAGELTYIADGLHTITYTAPAQPDPSAVDLLTVFHTAQTGARRNATEPRTATATIRFGTLTIAPRSACLEPGQTQLFTATVLGVTDQSVEWDASLGSINAGGLYTAPDATPGTQVQITATSVENPELTDTVTIRVGGCSCTFDMTTTGGITSSSSGPAGFYLLPDGKLMIELWGNVIGGARTPNAQVISEFAFSGSPESLPIGYGSVAAPDASISAVFSPSAGLTCPGCGGSLVIEKVEADRIEGFFSLTGVTGVPEQGLPPTVASASFSAARATPPYDGPISPFFQCVGAYDGG